MGMKTVWIKNNEPWAAQFSDADFINYKTDKLANFLKEINENKMNLENIINEAFENKQNISSNSDKKILMQ